MFQVITPISGRAVALASSIAVHAGVVVVLGGHADSARIIARSEPLSVDVTDAQEEPRPSRAAKIVPTAVSPARRMALHTHSYPVPQHHDAVPHDPSLAHAPLPTSSSEPPPSFALTVTAAAIPSAPRFAMVAGPQHSSTQGEADGETRPSGLGKGEPAEEAAVDTPARLLQGTPPPYPRLAAEAGIEAEVKLEIVVDATGDVQSARVLQQLGYGLEAASLRALRSYHFSPAILHGRPTPVRMKWTMVFRLQ